VTIRNPPCALAAFVFAFAALLLGACGEQATTSTSPTTAPVTPGRDRPEDPQASRSLLTPEDRRQLERFTADAPGRVGIAVTALGAGEVTALGGARTGRAWSTMKVPLLVALLDRLGGRRRLSESERSRAEAALTASDNEAALALFDRLQRLEGGLVPASRAIEAVLRRSGDSGTKVNTEPSPEGFSTFGQTIWSAKASTLFVRALAGGCLLSPGDTDYVLSLMERVVPGQRWGLGAAGSPDGASIAFKGGWGPEPEGGYLVRQSGTVTGKGAGYALSVIAVPDETGSESFAAGQELTSSAARLVGEKVATGRPAAVTCQR